MCDFVKFITQFLISYCYLFFSELSQQIRSRLLYTFSKNNILFFLFQSISCLSCFCLSVSSFVCIYTNEYNILCRFYVILFVHFYIKKYNSVPLYFISFFNFDILLNFDAIKYNGTLLYFLM